MNNPFESISRANDVIDDAISVASGKREYLAKQLINVILLFIILLVFGCLDFAQLTFHFEYLRSVSYWGSVFSKTVAGVCSFNIGINLMWEVEIRKDKILAASILLYNHLIKYKEDDFEHFITRVYNPREKKKAYISQINRQIYKLNRISKAKDRLLYSSDLPENQEKKLKNKYCIIRQRLEDLKKDDFIDKNLESLKVRYYLVDATIFELEIDGSAVVHGVKTRGNITYGKARASTNVIMGMVGISMFITAIALEFNQEQFESQMVRFWHYCLKCATDVGVVLWQTYRGMLNTRKIISQELTQPYVGRNKVLREYYKWRFEQGKLDEKSYNNIVKYEETVEVELTEEQLKKLKDIENK